MTRWKKVLRVTRVVLAELHRLQRTLLVAGSIVSWMQIIGTHAQFCKQNQQVVANCAQRFDSFEQVPLPPQAISRNIFVMCRLAVEILAAWFDRRMKRILLSWSGGGCTSLSRRTRS